jgi:shikimate kinase
VNRRNFLKRLGIGLAAAAPVGSIVGKLVSEKSVTVSSLSKGVRRKVGLKDYDPLQLDQAYAIQYGKNVEHLVQQRESRYVRHQMEAMNRARDKEIIEAATGGATLAQRRADELLKEGGLTIEKLIEAKRLFANVKVPKPMFIYNGR